MAHDDDQNKLFTDLIGMGEFSSRKSYYPELQEKLHEIKDLRDYLTDIINSMPSTIIGIDENIIITEWNRTAELRFKITSGEAVGQNLFSICPYLKEEETIIARSVIEQTITSNSRRLLLVDNKSFYDSITTYPLVSGNRKGAVIRIDDITETVKLEEMVIQSEKMLSLGGLAAGMAHELNNPLGGIIQNAQNLKNRIADETNCKNMATAESLGVNFIAIKEYAEERGVLKISDSIIEAGKRAAIIIKNMLSFARNTQSKFIGESIDIIINKVFPLIQTDYSYLVLRKRSNFDIQTEIPDTLPHLYCDEIQIQQVLLNIMKNGTEAMCELIENPDYTPFMKLKAYYENPMIVIEIENNGPPLNPNIQKSLFEPFVSTKPPGKGTGLGLSISYFIVTQAHKGDISVKTTSDNHTCFVIKIPVPE